jgi:hypothetical protein
MKNVALNAYFEVGCSNQIEEAQVFPGTGSQTAFAVTNFAGSHLGSVYVESQVNTTGVTFAAGVGSGFSGLTPSALIGAKCIHRGQFRGFIVANDATTVTISDTGYAEAVGSSAIICSLAKLILNTHYTVAIDGGTGLVTITKSSTALTTLQKLYATPAGSNGVSLNFGGAQGDIPTKETALWLKREPGYICESINIFFQDASITQSELTQEAITWADGVGSGFSGLATGALIGRAVIFGGLFIGLVTANSATTVTIDDTNYDNATANTAVIFTIGRARLAPDSSGAGTYVPVLNISDITDNTPVKIWINDTITIPNAAVNYPDQVLVCKFIMSLE